MADGTTKAISEVQVGDQVRSRDPQTGQESAKTVTATIKRQAPAVVTVSLTDAKTNKAETLTCTPEHPLYVQGQGWVEAGSLGLGSSIVSRAGPALSVASVTWHRNQTNGNAGAEKAAGSGGVASGGTASVGYTVYNLTVEDDHTYFVGTVGGGTWVHNVSNCGLTSRVKEFPNLLRKARDLPQETYDQAEHLLSQFEKGDPNPGIGNGNLEGSDIFYLRARGGARVFLRQGENGTEIVGYANKSNESQVINQLMRLFGR